MFEAGKCKCVLKWDGDGFDRTEVNGNADDATEYVVKIVG